jgi:hypothetical protein
MTDDTFVIVDANNDEHEFPVGMDPKKAAEIVRQRTAPLRPATRPSGPAPFPGILAKQDTQDSPRAAIAKDLARTGVATAKGMLESPIDLVTGTYGMVRHPIDTGNALIEGAFGAVGDPVGTARRVGQAVSDPETGGRIIGGLLLPTPKVGGRVAQGTGKATQAVGRGMEIAGESRAVKNASRMGGFGAGLALGAGGHVVPALAAGVAAEGLPGGLRIVGRTARKLGETIEDASARYRGVPKPVRIVAKAAEEDAAAAAEALRLKNRGAANAVEEKYLREKSAKDLADETAASRIADRAVKDAEKKVADEANRSKVSDAMIGREERPATVTETVKSGGHTVRTSYVPSSTLDAEAEALRLKNKGQANAVEQRHLRETEARTAKDKRAENATQGRVIDDAAKDAERLRQEGLATADKAVENARTLQQEGLAVADTAVEDATQAQAKADQAAERLRQEGLATADKAVETVTQSQNKAVDLARKDMERLRQEGLGTADKAVEDASKQLAKTEEEAAKATRIEKEMEGREAGTPTIRETIKAGDRSMTTSHTRPDVEVPVDPDFIDPKQFGGTPAEQQATADRVRASMAAGKPQPVLKVATPAGKTGATIAPQGPPGIGEQIQLPDGRTVSRAVAEGEGFTVPAAVQTTEAEARAAGETAKREAEARQARHQADLAVKNAPNPANDPAYLEYVRQDAQQRTAAAPTAPPASVDRPISPRDPKTGATAIPSPSVPTYHAGDVIGHPGAQQYISDELQGGPIRPKGWLTNEEIASRVRSQAPFDPPIQGASTPLPSIEDALLSRSADLTPEQLKIIQDRIYKPGAGGRILKLSPKTQAQVDQFFSDRAADGAVDAGKAVGLTPTDARFLDSSRRAGTMSTGRAEAEGGKRARGALDIEARLLKRYGVESLDDLTKDQILEYGRIAGNGNPALADHIQYLMDRARR